MVNVNGGWRTETETETEGAAESAERRRRGLGLGLRLSYTGYELRAAYKTESSNGQI
jgi:hypothetical protein